MFGVMSKLPNKVLALLVSLVLVEMGARQILEPVDLAALTGRKPTLKYVWSMMDDAFAAYVWSRNMDKVGKRGEHKTTNSHGFISTPELSVDKPTGTVRIVFLGGSSTVNYRLDDERTWPWKTVGILRDVLPEQSIDFINASNGGYSTFESYGRLWSRLRFFSPDIVVVYHMWNDFYYFARERMELWRVPEDGGGFTVAKPHIAKVYEPSFVDPFIQWSVFLSRTRLVFSTYLGDEAVRVKEPYEGQEVTHYRRKNLEVFRTNLKLIREAARIMGAELFVIKQPTMVVDAPLAQRVRFFPQWHGFSYEEHLEAIPDVYRVIDEEIDRDHVIDASIFSGNRELIRDHVHLSDVGTTALAELVSLSLVESEILKLGKELK